MATTENYVLKDGQLVPDESITTRTNVGKVPNLDIQLKPMITDNYGSDLSTQTAPDIDWNQNQNIINVGGFRGFGKRKALRDALNASKNTLIWNGNGFQRVNTGLGADKWSRRDVRRLMKSYNDNWSTYNNKVPLEGNNANYATYLSENYLANNPTATNFRWIAGKYPQQQVEAQQNEIQTNTAQEPIKEPSFYSELRNNDLQEANKKILFQNNERRDVASEFAANKQAYEDAINKEKQRQLRLQEYAKKAQQDGFYDAEAVKSFQNMMGLPEDGIYGPQTQAAFSAYYNGVENFNQEAMNSINVIGIKRQGGTIMYQQGGDIRIQQQDKEEQLLQYALFSIIGANDDIDLNTAISAIAEAYIKDPQSLTQVIQDEDTIKQGMQKLEQENPGSVKQITQPGFMKKVISKLVSQKQQGIKQAKMGTKLDYIKQLKNICPEGYEIEFRKAGGSVCPVCKKKHKTKKAEQGEKIEKDCGGGISKTMNSIKNAMKCGGKVKKAENGLEAKKPQKKQDIHPADTLHSGKKIYDLSGKYKQYPYLTPKRYQQLPQKDKVNADLKDEERGRKKGDER